MKKLWVLFFGLCLSLPIFAQAVAATAPVPRVVFPTTVVGNNIGLGPVTANAANAANFSFGAAANGSIFANTGTRLATAGGASVDVDVAGRVSGAAAGAAIGRAALKIVAPLQIGLALFDLAKELGFTLGRSASNDLTLSRQVDESTCQVTSTTTNNATNTCQGNGFPSGSVVTIPLATSSCTLIYRCDKAGGGTYDIQAGSVPKISAFKESPSTLAEFTDAVASKSGWPQTSAVGRALLDAIKTGESVSVIPSAVTGPASQPVSSTAGVNPANNTSTVTNVVQNYSYGPSSVTVTNNTTTTTTNTSTGAVTSSPIVTDTSVQPSTPPEPLEIITCGLPTTPPCKIDESGVPDGSVLKQDAAKDTYKQIQDLVADPKSKLPQIPTIAWDFALPTGCAVIPLPAFEPFVKPIDVCQFRPMFHDIMTVVWLLGGLFGAISMFFKSALAD